MQKASLLIEKASLAGYPVPNLNCPILTRSQCSIHHASTHFFCRCMCHSPLSSPTCAGACPKARTKHVHASCAAQMEHFNSSLTYHPNKRDLLQRHMDAMHLLPSLPKPVSSILLRRAAPFSSNHYGRENATLSTLGAQPALICRAKHEDVKDAFHIINTGHCFFSGASEAG